MASTHEGGYHVGIILDGNGRWASAQGKPRLFGHAEGVRNVQRIVEACPAAGVHTLSLYAFAIANWKRDQGEVDGLWNLFRHFFTNELEVLIENGARVQLLGDIAGLPTDVQDMVLSAEERSRQNREVRLLVGLHYDGVDEVTRATRAIAVKAAAGEIDAASITAATIAAHLDTKDVPDPDIIIRTGMSHAHNETGMALWRSSSFLQLQSAQAVCVSTPILWPDFSSEDLDAAIAFAKPDERLFGGQRTQSPITFGRTSV